MTVKEAMDEINHCIKRYKITPEDLRAVRDHWFWAVIVPDLKEDDEMPQQEYDDIWEHLKWYSAVPSAK